jgi:hypothetical protein
LANVLAELWGAIFTRENAVSFKRRGWGGKEFKGSVHRNIIPLHLEIGNFESSSSCHPREGGNPGYV